MVSRQLTARLRRFRDRCRLRWRLYRVRGSSMAPILQDGDLVVVDTMAFRTRPPQAGDIVVARHPFHPRRVIIKRVRTVRADGTIFLEGNARYDSTDSHAFGPIPPALLIGRVIRTWRIGTTVGDG